MHVVFVKYRVISRRERRKNPRFTTHFSRSAIGLPGWNVFCGANDRQGMTMQCYLCPLSPPVLGSCFFVTVKFPYIFWQRPLGRHVFCLFCRKSCIHCSACFVLVLHRAQRFDYQWNREICIMFQKNPAAGRNINFVNTQSTICFTKTGIKKRAR